ncbi:MAG TPA: DUF4407 domain-containing protein [Fulvivirga sp.]|nr:DUF4407 domain-containing protein [Fulvivirga sp.]
MEKVKIFFWYCSGADSSLLKDCPTESSRYVGIGATIFFTGLFAALAAGYALFTVFDSIPIAFILGLVWGLMIFNLDRYIVSSMRKRGSVFNEFKMALPRIILALFISIVIAKPLELKIFEKEINAELTLMEQEIYARQENQVREKFIAPRNVLTAEIAQLKQEIEVKAAKRDELATIAQQEADGTGGTGKRNAGPIYRIKKADADRQEMELQLLVANNTALINSKLQELGKLDSINSAELANLKREGIGGPATRIDALGRLTEQSTAIWWTNLFIILLFIAIETSPIFVKLISNKGPYDYSLETKEYLFETGTLSDKAYIHSQLKKQSESLAKKEKDFVSDALDLKLDGI